MVTYSDIEYELTKLIKQGKAKIDEDFRLLKDWIDKTYDVDTMNIIYDVIDNPSKTPRLQIVFEFKKDEGKFIDQDISFNFDSEKQKSIADQFRQVLYDAKKVKEYEFLSFFRKEKTKYKTDNLLVVFSVFEPIAREEAHSKVLQQQLDYLKEKIGRDDIWTVVTAFASFTVFFYTEKQVEVNVNSPLRKEITRLCFELVKQYDEFGYLNGKTYSVSIDSKENFDNKYSSSWFYYYR